MMFYTAVYVGDIYESGLPDSVDPTSEEVDAEATRRGTGVLFWSACINLFSNFALPLLVSQTPKHRTVGDLLQEEGEGLKRAVRRFQTQPSDALENGSGPFCLVHVQHVVSSRLLGDPAVGERAYCSRRNLAGCRPMGSIHPFEWATTPPKAEIPGRPPIVQLGEAIRSESATGGCERDENIPARRYPSGSQQRWSYARN